MKTGTQITIAVLAAHCIAAWISDLVFMAMYFLPHPYELGPLQLVLLCLAPIIVTVRYPLLIMATFLGGRETLAMPEYGIPFKTYIAVLALSYLCIRIVQKLKTS